MQYEVRGFTKLSEEDVWSKGCIPSSGGGFHDNQMRFVSDSVEGLIEKIISFTDAPSRDCLILDSCDEDGRLDVQVLETAEGYAASPHDIELWKSGEKRLWLCDYIFYIEQVDRKPLTLLKAA